MLLNAASVRQTFDGIQMLRAVAAIAVLIHHTLINLSHVASVETPLNSFGHFDDLGAAGVDLFFVISGFIMMYVSHHEFGRDGAVTRFLWRRAIRIYPLYWLYTSVILALAVLPGMFRNLQFDTPYVIKSLMLVPALRPGPHPTIHPLLDQGWTLSYEVGFYLAFAVCLAVGSTRKALWALPALFAVLVATGHLLTPASEAAQFLSLPLPFEFCFGMLIAWALLNQRLPMHFHGVALLLAVLLFAASAMFKIDPMLRPLVWGIPSALFVYAAVGIPLAGNRVGRLLVVLGNASYSIYLTHAFVIFAVAHIARGRGDTLLSALAWQAGTLITCIVVGHLAYIAVERPLLARLSTISLPFQRRVMP